MTPSASAGHRIRAPVNDLVPMFINPSTGLLCTSAELLEWYRAPMTDDEKENGFAFAGGYVGLFEALE